MYGANKKWRGKIIDRVDMECPINSEVIYEFTRYVFGYDTSAIYNFFGIQEIFLFPVYRCVIPFLDLLPILIRISFFFFGITSMIRSRFTWGIVYREMKRFLFFNILNLFVYFVIQAYDYNIQYTSLT